MVRDLVVQYMINRINFLHKFIIQFRISSFLCYKIMSSVQNEISSEIRYSLRVWVFILSSDVCVVWSRDRLCLSGALCIAM